MIEDVEIYEQIMYDGETPIGKIALLVGTKVSNPIEHMDKAVKQYVNGAKHNQFIEIHLDNPWTRMVTNNLQNLPFKKLSEDDTLE